MSFSIKVPVVEKCCGCVTDLKTAAAIIAVLGIVTSPAVSWAVVRHSFVIRVSCFVTTSAVRADVVDINLNNILSFGFGANAGLGPSCLGPKQNTVKNSTVKPSQFIFRTDANSVNSTENTRFVSTVRWIGWFVLIADLIFVGFSIRFLYKLYRPPDRNAGTHFVASCLIAILFSFIYGMLYVGACLSVGGSFPVFEFLFCIVDLLIYSTWIYFALVIRSYIRYNDRESLKVKTTSLPGPIPGLLNALQSLAPVDFWTMLFEYIATLSGHHPAGTR